MLFWISLIIFLVSVIGLIAVIGCFVYHDAKMRADKPITWTLISILVPSFMGFLSYILVGRTKKESSDGKYKRLVTTFAIAVVTSTLLFGGVIMTSNHLPIMGGVSVGMVNHNIGSKWKVSFKTSGERLERTVKLNAQEREAFIVSGACESGRLYLLFLQNENVKLIDITDTENKSIDLSEFSDDKITMMLYNENARNAKINISW